MTRKGVRSERFRSVTKMGFILKDLEQIPGAEAPNLARKLTGGPGVGGGDGGGLVLHVEIQLVVVPLVLCRI